MKGVAAGVVSAGSDIGQFATGTFRARKRCEETAEGTVKDLNLIRHCTRGWDAVHSPASLTRDCNHCWHGSNVLRNDAQG